eukprot:CAMPEP_0115033692 /NCGR_PEP_ID=MMETSP0216-20121206/40113_1 /TAXON_ID=223996 /ORGANISM="Protocruzia adherens, Strain Boccale" /LENGTH=331 /DNA_ID=CAMNT_0002412247 /DNA_START=33 /DNA_END=1028 /DNA_ORIENTATION=-
MKQAFEKIKPRSASRALSAKSHQGFFGVSHRYGFARKVGLAGRTSQMFPFKFGAHHLKINSEEKAEVSATNCGLPGYPNFDDTVKHVYMTLVHAFKNQDLDTLEEILEPCFYRKVVDNFHDLEDQNLFIQTTGMEEDENDSSDEGQTTDNDLDNLEAELVYTAQIKGPGVSIDRDILAPLESRENTKVHIMRLRYSDFYRPYCIFYTPLEPAQLKETVGDGLDMYTTVYRVAIRFTSGIKFLLQDKDGAVVAGSDDKTPESHTILLESVMYSEEALTYKYHHINDLYVLMTKGKSRLIDNAFQRWYVVDIDNFGKQSDLLKPFLLHDGVTI